MIFFNDNLKKEYIIGCDECGYGSLAGSVVVCGLKAPKDWNLEGLNDSKKLSEKKRDIMRNKLLELVNKNEISYFIAERSNEEIDQIGIALALKNSYVDVFHKLYDNKSFIIVDGILRFDNMGVDAYDKQSIVKADEKIPQVMAASILGKTYRDSKMKEYHQLYSQYDWINNMGYGSAKHLAALYEHGPSILHRFSYAPIKNMKKI